MARPAPTRTELALYVAIVVTQYAAAAGITTIYSMLCHLYRDFDDLGSRNGDEPRVVGSPHAPVSQSSPTVFRSPTYFTSNSRDTCGMSRSAPTPSCRTAA